MSGSSAAARGGDFAFRLWLLAAAVVMLDSVLSYFARAQLGHGLQVNAVLPALVLVGAVASPGSLWAPPPGYLAPLMLGYGGFVVGIFSFGDPSLARLTTMSSGFAAFFIGYALAMHIDAKRIDPWMRVLAAIGVIYVVVCAAALAKIAPGWFPTIEAIRFRDGVLVARPEVTTDQNFQLFYLLPCVIALFARSRFWMAAALFASVGSLAVLAQLQTRSGAIVFAFAVMLALFSLLRRSQNKVAVFAALAIGSCIALGLSFQKLISLAQPLIERFTKDDLSTFEGRLWSAGYLFEHIADPAWWIPQGNEPFQRLSGGEVPHFNGTAFFLEGGLLGLMCWLMVHVYAVARAILLFLRDRLTPVGEAITVIAGSTLLASTTLNVPYVELVWMWMGAALAVQFNPHLQRTLQPTPVGAARAHSMTQASTVSSYGNLMR